MLSAKKRFVAPVLGAMMLLICGAAIAQPPVLKDKIKLLSERIWVINMIPNAQSGETGQDSEPNLAVDPADANNIVGSAFTVNPTGAANRAPIYVSQDRGMTWALNNIVPSGNGMTSDISVAFPTSGGTLYAGTLRGGAGNGMNILRSADPFGVAVMAVLVNRLGVDQPWVEARTTTVSGANNDRVFVGNNDFNAAVGHTASVDLSLNAATAPAPAGFTTARIEVRSTQGQDMPAIRTAIHNDGTAYAVFYRWAGGNVPAPTCDVVVVRDDNWGSAAVPYGALVDPGDTLAGVRVVQGVVVPAFPANLGGNRLVASNLSIAVDPNNSNNVWIAWADRPAGSTAYTLHVRSSTNRGGTWSGDLLTVASATNPALAINSSGAVGFLYQQLVGTAPNARWETHFRRTGTGSTWSDLTLANTPDNNPAPTFQPYLGDYTDVLAVGRSFYGVFSASNIPNLANFPNGVIYQRNANFTTNRLLALDGVTPVNPSIDPFFFRIEPPVIVDICAIHPRLCVTPVFEREIIKINCTVLPCRVIDPLPKNCLVKFKCPGCDGFGLCPPWYHIYLDGVDPRVWQVNVFTTQGDPLKQAKQRTTKGMVISFRPSRRLFKEGEIGDYVLTFESDKVKLGQSYAFGTRLETSEYPLKEHLVRRSERASK
jgi:hypothetical protein